MGNLDCPAQQIKRWPLKGGNWNPAFERIPKPAKVGNCCGTQSGIFEEDSGLLIIALTIDSDNRKAWGGLPWACKTSRAGLI